MTTAREARQLQVLHAKLVAWQPTIERATSAKVSIAVAEDAPAVIVAVGWAGGAYVRTFPAPDVDVCACTHARAVIADVLAKRGV